MLKLEQSNIVIYLLHQDKILRAFHPAMLKERLSASTGDNKGYLAHLDKRQGVCDKMFVCGGLVWEQVDNFHLIFIVVS